ncbi:hypothetical protein F5148DRAFT_1344170, partial [Russula earlei]
EVLVMRGTRELGQIFVAMHQTSTNLSRTAFIPTAIVIAQLALKHQQNKNLCQHVIVFIGSLLEDTSPDTERALVRLAKKLNKTNVVLNIIEEVGEGSHSILRAFVKTASSSNNLHYLAVSPGPHLSSITLNSPILASDRGIPDELATIPGGKGGGVLQFEFGINPSLGPKLAMMSMEEEAAQQAAANTLPQPPPGAAAPAAAGPDGVPAQPSQLAAATKEGEEADLQQALALSEGRTIPDIEMTGECEREEDLMKKEMIAPAIVMSM